MILVIVSSTGYLRNRK